MRPQCDAIAVIRRTILVGMRRKKVRLASGKYLYTRFAAALAAP